MKHSKCQKIWLDYIEVYGEVIRAGNEWSMRDLAAERFSLHPSCLSTTCSKEDRVFMI